MLTPRYTVAQLREFRRGDRQNAALKSLEIDLEDLEPFMSRDNDDIALALVHLNGMITWLGQIELDNYLLQPLEIEELPPPDFQVARVAFADRLIQCRDWLQFRSEAGVNMSEIGSCMADLVAIGQTANARLLHAASTQVMQEFGYSWQMFWKGREGKEQDLPDEEFPTQKLVPFMHELFAAENGEEVEWDDFYIRPDLAYIEAAQSVMSTDIARVKAAIDTLCDLHIEFSPSDPEGDAGPLDGFEIDGWDHLLWPSTVFAYLRIRQAHGLALPELTHPLLTQPMGQFTSRPFKTKQLPDWVLPLLNRLGEADPSLADIAELVSAENR